MNMVGQSGSIPKNITLLLLCLFVHSVMVAQTSEGTIILQIDDPTPILEHRVQVRLIERTTESPLQELYAEPQSEVVLRNIPFGSYRLVMSADSLPLAEQLVDIRSTVPLRVRLTSQKEYHLGEVVVSKSVNRLISSETATQSVYTAAVINQMPAVSADKKIEAILLNTPGVVPDEDGRMHVRGEHAQLQYIIDGIPITADLSRVYSSLLNPEFAKAITIQTGCLDPEYGVATSGVLAITSKSGFDKPLFAKGGVQYGSFGEKGTSVEVGGNLQNQTAFYATASLNESNRYLDPISGFDPIHDYGRSESAFGKFNSVLGESADLHVLGMYNHTLFYVPNGTTASIQDQRQSLSDEMLGARLDLQLQERSLLSFLVYGRYGAAEITSGGLKQITNGADWQRAIQENDKFFIGGSRTEHQYGAQAEYSMRLAKADASHEIKSGVAGEVYPLSEFFTFAVTNPALSDSSLPGGDIRYRAIDITQGGVPFFVNASRRGYRYSAYLQDDVGFGKWRLGVGARFDDFNLFDNESFFSPRINAAYLVEDDLVLRASYNRIVMEAPLENILVSSSNQARTLAGQQQGSTPNRVTSERSHVFELGAAYRLDRYVDLDLSGYSKLINDFLVNVELGDSGALFPVNLKQGFVAGGELRAQLRDWNNLSGSLSLSTCLSEGLKPSDGSSPIAAGLIMGEEGQSYSHPFAGESSFFTEHNQLFTAVMSLGYRLSNVFTATLGGRFDSGLPFDLADKNGVGLDEQASRTELQQRGYSNEVINLLSLASDKPGSPDKSVAPHTVFDVGLSANLRDAISFPLTCSISVLNVLDTPYLYKFESSFGGTHFGVPRTLLFSLQLDV
jgi:hypothetical protein